MTHWHLPLRETAAAGAVALALLAAPPLARAQQAGDARLEEIVVTSSLIEMPRRQIGTAVSIMTGESMELRGYNALADALRTQPGIGVSNSGGPGKSTSLRIRGEESFRTQLIIDGVKAVDPSAPQVGPSFDSLLVTSDLERIEILRGPQGFMYGADAGGIVNILTHTGAGPLGGRIGLEMGDFATRKLDASLAGGSERGDYFVSVTSLDTDGFNAQTTDTVLRDADGAKNTTLHTKLGWNATDSLRLQFVARDIDARAEHDGCFTTSFAPTNDCVALTDQRTYKVSATHDADRARNVVGYSRMTIVRDNLAEAASAFVSDGELSRFEYTGSYRASASATLVYGVDLQTERVASDEVLERDQNAAYVEYQGTFGDRFYLSAGARRDDNDDFGTFTSSRVSGAYVQDFSSGRSVKYRASFGTGFRAPSLFEIAYNRGPFSFPPASLARLREERSRGYDLGLEYDYASGLHLELTYFDQDIEDEIFFDLLGFSGYLQSPGRSESKGVELAAAVPLGERWQLLGNWTRNDATNTTNEQRLRRPRNFGNVGLLYAAVNEKLRVAVNYRLARDSIDIGGVALDDYEVLDLSMAYAFAAGLELYARVENASDERYQEVIGFNTAGRAGYAGVRLRF